MKKKNKKKTKTRSFHESNKKEPADSDNGSRFDQPQKDVDSVSCPSNSTKSLTVRNRRRYDILFGIAGRPILVAILSAGLPPSPLSLASASFSFRFLGVRIIPG